MSERKRGRSQTSQIDMNEDKKSDYKLWFKNTTK